MENQDYFTRTFRGIISYELEIPRKQIRIISYEDVVRGKLEMLREAKINGMLPKEAKLNDLTKKIVSEIKK